MKYFFTFFTVLFFILLFVFIVGGVAIVGTQFFGVVTLDSAPITGAAGTFSSIVFICATLCALCAFILQYTPEARARQRTEAQANAQALENADES